MAGVRWANFRLVLSLAPAVAISASSSVAPEYSPIPGSRPYLTSTGAPGLRFGEAPPPPDLRPAAGAPPQPKEEFFASADEQAAAETLHLAPDAAVPTPAPDIKPAPAKISPAILPDDTRSKVRAEDFLPFFQFPGSASHPGDVTVVVPAAPGAAAPAPLPPSSATYRQQ
ncbi:MAG: hypothetical protein C0518_11665 [Opitutus sp.]|nr:hypothetical protein [Opitutus sp.]